MRIKPEHASRMWSKRRMPAVTASAGILIAAFLCLSHVSCEGEAVDIARLIIDSEVPVPASFNEIEVSASTSKTSEGEFCTPMRRTFIVTSDADMPLIVDYVFGSEYRAWIAFRVVWRLEGVKVYEREVVRAFVAGERQEIDVTFSQSCVDRTCGEDQQCVDGSCESIPSMRPFDSDTGPPCENEALE
ncbi:MAG: hypothetical protein ABIJ56_12520 [Pseudomonadota bacterium]